MSEDYNIISSIVIGSAIEVHKHFGPGLLESVYEEALCYLLLKEGMQIERQKQVPVYFDNLEMGIGFRADIIVENCIIVELKSVETILPVHAKQLMTYLRLSKMKLGLLINFNEELLKNGIKRIIV
jgi:GxxExxY protein